MMPETPKYPLPVWPLIEYLCLRAEPVWNDIGCERARISVRTAAEALSASDGRNLHTAERNLFRWQQTGLSAVQADRLAVVVGKHPSAIWGDEWFHLPEGACGPADFTAQQLYRRRLRESMTAEQWERHLDQERANRNRRAQQKKNRGAASAS